MTTRPPNLRLLLGIAFGLAPAFTGCGDDPTDPELTDPRLFISASAGGTHTCAITTEGVVLCWGQNNFGQVGDGTELARNTPTPVSTQLTFSAISVGGTHTCALTQEGVAYCWGWNGHGQLGLGTDEQFRSDPGRVSTDLQFTNLSAGYSHTCGVDTGGDLHCWGNNIHSQIGAEVTEDCGVPCTRVPIPVETEVRFESVSAGMEHTCGVARNGRVYCWGSNEYGVLGVSTSEICETIWGASMPCSKTPIPVSGGASYWGVGTGDFHSCALAENGTVSCWGSGELGAVGNGAVTGIQQEPSSVAGNLKFQELSAGGYRSCAVSEDGTIHCWGSAELGDGSGEGSPVPVPVASTVRFTSVTVGGGHTCGLSVEGILYCWGWNRYGQLGDGSGSLGWSTPVVVKGW